MYFFLQWAGYRLQCSQEVEHFPPVIVVVFRSLTFVGDSLFECSVAKPSGEGTCVPL